MNNVVDGGFKVLRTEADRERFMLLSDTLRDPDNALDSRSGKVIPIKDGMYQPLLFEEA